MKKVYLLLLSLVVLMIALTGCGKDKDSAKDNSEPITLRYSTMQNKDHISYQVALNIKQAVEEKTEGRVLIDIYPANQLGDWSQVYDELMMAALIWHTHLFPRPMTQELLSAISLTFRAAMISLRKYLQKAPLLTI